MRYIQEQVKYNSIDDFQKDYKKLYVPLIKSEKIKNFTYIPVNQPDNSVCYTLSYYAAAPAPIVADARELARASTSAAALPEWVKASAEIQISVPSFDDAVYVMDNYYKWWPNMPLKVYGLAQVEDSDVSLYMKLQNFEEEEDESEDEEEEELYV